MFEHTRYWQKGAIIGFLMITAIGGVQFLAIVANEARLEAQGLAHVCAGGTLCSFVEASGSYGRAFFIMVVVLGIFAGMIGGVLGYLIDRTQLKD